MLHIINACFVGKFGLADYTLSLARALSQYSKSEIVTAKDFSYPEVPFDGVVTRLFRRTRTYPIDVFRFFVYVLRQKPDAVILQSRLKWAFLDGLVVRVLRVFGIKVGTTVHDVLPHYPRLWSRLEFKFFYKGFDFLIVHSSAAESQIRALGVRAPVLCVPHGVYDIYRLGNTDRISARRDIGGIKEDDFVGLFFGLIDERKGISEVIDFLDSADVPENFKLLVAGGMGVSQTNKDLRARFDRAISGEKCRAIVARIPFSEVEKYFLAADFVLVPYREGTTSGVVKLAIAFGKPIVASDVGDLPETVTDEVGVLISHKNISGELGAAISKLNAIYEELICSFASVERKYSWDKIGREYYDFVAKNVSKGGR